MTPVCGPSPNYCHTSGRTQSFKGLNREWEVHQAHTSVTVMCPQPFVHIVYVKELIICTYVSLYLSTAVGSFLHAEANEQWISQFNQDVINTVDMKILHPPSLHILQDLVV